MAESLKKRTLKGVGWSAVDAVLGQGVTFVVGIVLARLLSPSEYGLIGICLIFTTILNGVVDSGFSEAVIRKKEPSDSDYSTMFMVNMMISVVMYVALFASAPAIARFFEHDELTTLLRVLGVLLIINAMGIVQMTFLTKRIDFKTKAKVSFLSAILSGAVGIVMAYRGYGVWALVAQQLSRQTFYTLFLWVFNRFWFPFVFSQSSAKEMWSFGWKLMASGLLNSIWDQLNQVVVGKYYSPATLGQYTKGKEFANLLSSNLTTIIQRVTYPVLAEIQDERERMVAAYRKIIRITMLISCVGMLGLAAVSDPLICWLIGPEWHEAATYMPLICLLMSLYPLHAINLNMLKVQGRSDLFLQLEVIKKILSLVPLYIGFAISIKWMLAAMCIVSVLAFFLNAYYNGRYLAYGALKQIKDVIPAYALGGGVAAVLYFLTKLF